MDTDAKSLDQYLDSSPVSIKITDLHRSFGENHVLKGIDLEVAAGETMVILGKSGSGKSVLLRHIVGLETPDSGKISINDEFIDPEELHDKHRIAIVFQSSALFNSLSVEDNVGLYLKEHRIFNDKSRISKLVNEALSVVGLEGVEKKFPSELSGGMKRRVATARAIVMNPDLILFDEPTSGLDPVMTKTIGDLILDLKQQVKVTQVVVTHDIELAFYIADRIAVLSNGKILQIGTPREIYNSRDPEVQNFISPKFELNVEERK